uniref:Uncharacterized protein n=1 Tax=Monopterus albus TaxID=43700 RepID=A0A3Q3R0A1_MONAL
LGHSPIRTPKHTHSHTVGCKILRKLLSKIPSASFSYSNTENLWINLKRGVHSRQPSNLVDLEQVYHEQWAKITPKRIQTLLRGYPRRRLEMTYNVLEEDIS